MENHNNGHDRIVVPMVDYEFNASTGAVDFLQWQSKENYMYNLSILLQWSPYSTETELHQQFDAIGSHGTRVIIYNLWFNDDSTLELDFESDTEDIRIAGGPNKLTKEGVRMSATEQHIANLLRYSLRAYLSILYLRLPPNFCMLLRGRVVEYHNIATDLIYPEFIVYRPHSGGHVEGEVLTTIGFLKEAPHVNIHGFNVYHKNRLILPFWRVVNFAVSRGRGVVGVLEANFIQPSHNKQDFEKTNSFQKLEVRLKEMTLEYWDYHCGYIGYAVTKKPRGTSQVLSDPIKHVAKQPVLSSKEFSTAGSALPSQTYIPPEVASSNELARRPGQLIHNHIPSQEGAHLKRRDSDRSDCEKEPVKVKRKAVARANIIDSSSCLEVQPTANTGKQLEDQQFINLMEKNRTLNAQFLENERMEAALNEKVMALRIELEDAQSQYAALLSELQSLEKVKVKNKLR